MFRELPDHFYTIPVFTQNIWDSKESVFLLQDLFSGSTEEKHLFFLMSDNGKEKAGKNANLPHLLNQIYWTYHLDFHLELHFLLHLELHFLHHHHKYLHHLQVQLLQKKLILLCKQNYITNTLYPDILVRKKPISALEWTACLE